MAHVIMTTTLQERFWNKAATFLCAPMHYTTSVVVTFCSTLQTNAKSARRTERLGAKRRTKTTRE
jgi:hypothetical protein